MSMAADTKYGCSIAQVVEPDSGATRWHVRIHYRSEHQTIDKTYAIRDKRMKAFKDCDAWLTRVERGEAHHKPALSFLPEPRK